MQRWLTVLPVSMGVWQKTDCLGTEGRPEIAGQPLSSQTQDSDQSCNNSAGLCLMLATGDCVCSRFSPAPSISVSYLPSLFSRRQNTGWD